MTIVFSISVYGAYCQVASNYPMIEDKDRVDIP